MTELDGFDYAIVVKRVAKFLAAPSGKTDLLGNVQDDYISELCLTAIEAARAFQTRYGGSSRHESRYVYKSLWNYARRVNSMRRHRVSPSFENLNAQLDPISLEDSMEAREALHILREKLEPTDWKILGQMAQSNGDTTIAWKMNPEGSRGYFRARVRSAQDQARAILQLE